VLVLAQEEAGLLNHSFIGTEHVLLGLIKEEEGIAAKALASFGISLEAVRGKVEETIGMGGSPPSGSPPFTPRAKKVFELSLREALQLGHSYVGTEHLLLGLLREGEGVAAQVLVSLGADLEDVRQRVVVMLPESTDTGSAETERFASPRLSYGHRVQRPAVLRRVFPPVFMMVSAGLAGFAAGWMSSRLSLRVLAGRLADVEARLDRVVDAAHALNHDHRRARVGANRSDRY
jgi:ATP-dependent Clp protease ATP-binding subunit ClpA